MRSVRPFLVLLLAVAAACGATAPEPTRSPPTTATPRVIEPSAQVLAALSDDVVSAEELTAAYRNSVDCLAAGGAVGRYAFDLSISPALALEIGIPDDGRAGELTEALMFFCEQRHIGDVFGVYAEANPVTDDHRRRGAEAMVACLEQAGIEASGSVAEMRAMINELVLTAEPGTPERSAASDCYAAGDSGPWQDLGG